MEQKKVTLTDLYAASFLDLHGVHPAFEIVRDKVLFSYPATDNIYKLLNEYNSGGSCSAADFAQTMKDLRARMMDAKRDGVPR